LAARGLAVDDWRVRGRSRPSQLPLQAQAAPTGLSGAQNYRPYKCSFFPHDDCAYASVPTPYRLSFSCMVQVLYSLPLSVLSRPAHLDHHARSATSFPRIHFCQTVPNYTDDYGRQYRLSRPLTGHSVPYGPSATARHPPR